jgi:hypothetical protein
MIDSEHERRNSTSQIQTNITEINVPAISQNDDFQSRFLCRSTLHDSRMIVNGF